MYSQLAYEMVGGFFLFDCNCNKCKTSGAVGVIGLNPTSHTRSSFIFTAGLLFCTSIFGRKFGFFLVEILSSLVKFYFSTITTSTSNFELRSTWLIRIFY